MIVSKLSGGWARGGMLAVGGLVALFISGSSWAGLADVYWSPEKLSNTVMWLDATTLSSVQTNASGQVSQWNDRSTNGNHVVQGNTSLQPLAGYAINGLHAIRSDGVDDYMRNSSVLIGTSGDVAIFAVSAVVTVDNSADGLLSLLPGFELRAGNSSAFTPEYFPGYVKFSGGPFSGPSIYEVAVSTNQVNAWGYVDGTERLSTDKIEVLKTTTDVSVFAKRGGAGFSGFLACDIGEVVLVKDDLSIDTRQKVEGYLAWKWEIEGNLPEDHPYKKTPPGKQPSGTVIVVR